jgi:hypothetical protein
VTRCSCSTGVAGIRRLGATTCALDYSVIRAATWYFPTEVR